MRTIKLFTKLLFAALFFAALLSSETSLAQTELWGMTLNGGDYGGGVIFKTDADGNSFQIEHNFIINNEGKTPLSNLCEASNGKLYGMTGSGGSHDFGVIFEYDPINLTYLKIITFNGNNGSYPVGGLIEASNGLLYGVTKQGGSYNQGVIFEYNPSTNTLNLTHEFQSYADGQYPNGTLLKASNNKLYGVGEQGGANGNGVIFEYDITTNNYTKKFDFDDVVSGRYPSGKLAYSANEKLFGVTTQGGANNDGVFFEYDINTSTYTKRHDFDETITGKSAREGPIFANNGNLYGVVSSGGQFNYGALYEFNPVNNIFIKKADFN